LADVLPRLTEALSDRYRLERELGQGGMATVYLAQDLKHDRRVAVKVLRPELAAVIGADRFLSEIKTTANLQHPHILPLFDSGEADGFLFYVMPYVEGETVRDRMTREKQLPVADAVRITTEVAAALDYAHRHGVIHRDIKPENILLHDGSALVADFGIALAASKAGGSRMTETGMSLGTPHYMSPEQAMGEREITARSDVYALGCVLYEMLTGDPPFTGSTAQAIVARVVTETPRAMLPQRGTIPAHVEAAVLTSLQKLPADRFKTAAEFAEALADSRYASASTVAMTAASAPRSRSATLTPWLVAGVALVAGLAIGARVLSRPAAVRPLRLSIPVPSELPPVAIRLSPDGGTLAYVSGQGDRLSIYTRRLDDLRPRRLDGTEDGFTVSFSPDGQSIAYLGTNSSPRKVPIGGGTSVAIPVEGGAGLTAIEFDGLDRFVVATQGALATLAANGALTRFAVPDSASGQTALALDQVLPDHWVLARYWRAPPNGPVLAIDPATGRRVTVLDANVAWAGYANGLLVWALPDGTLFSAPWDLKKKGPVGSGTPLGATVLSILGFLPPVSVSPSGLAYVPTQPRALVQVDRAGRSTVLLETDRSYHNPRVSPDGGRVSMDFTEQERDVWLFDIADSTLTRFGFDSTAHDAEWMPDGRGLLFAVVRNGTIGEFRRQFDKGGRADSVFFGPEQISIHSVTADQQTGIGVVIEGSAFDIVAVNLEGPARFDTLLASRYSEGWPALSPDNRWLAYQSDESGRMEVYLRAWPTLGSKVQVSQNGGTEPTWSRDGRELFYRSGGGAEPKLVAAVLADGRVQTRTELFSVGRYEFSTPHRNYDVFPDGRSFAMVRQGMPGQQAEVVYLQNLPGLMQQR
jgi:serine/threonine protein kinase/Tol biopolymer transport system component